MLGPLSLCKDGAGSRRCKRIHESMDRLDLNLTGFVLINDCYLTYEPEQKTRDPDEKEAN